MFRKNITPDKKETNMKQAALFVACSVLASCFAYASTLKMKAT
jgi:hypothetical protein